MFIFALAAAFLAAEDGALFFEKNIRPVLVERCLSCHSATSNPVMGNLKLDSREALLKGGSRGPAIAPGNVQDSLLLKALRHIDGTPKMPPGRKVPDAELAAFTQWVQMGAPWGSTAAAAPKQAAKFWAFVPPAEPAVPAVKNPAWVRGALDAFILAGLENKSLTPARPADKRTLIRRATYDLTGLPPQPEDVQAFLNDPSTDAFARVIDRLLQSPRYGERWGRHWLDVARYADSNGLDENLVYKNAFRYRDYVVRAFNKDKPYDLFVKEQLAGDLLPEADQETTFERWTATGFLSLGAKMLAEDDPVKMEMDIIDEQLDTTARTFMGLTVGCARCHDHKFDPIPQADYYSMAGIFKSSKTMENFKVVAKWHEYVLAPKADRDKLAAHETAIEAKQKEIGAITKTENTRLSEEARAQAAAYLLASHDAAEAARIPLTALGSADGAIVVEAADFRSGNVSKPLEKQKSNAPKDSKGPYFAEYAIRVPAAGEYRIELLDQERGRGTQDLLVNGELTSRGAPPVENREASPDQGGWSSLGVFELKAGENVVRLEHKSRFPYFAKLLAAPKPAAMRAPRTSVQIARAHGVNPSFLEQMVEHLGRSNGAPASPLYDWETLPAARDRERPALAAAYRERFRQALADQDPKDPGLKALRELLYEKFGPFRAPADARLYYTAPAIEQLARLEREHKALEAATPDYPRAMGVTENSKIQDLAVHLRGSHWNLGKVVPRQFLSAAGGQRPLGTQSSGRLDLAEWMTRKDHPLTARVMANRIWRWHFGKGIVPSVDNFGRLGEAPTNQPLLDWLALRFVESGWSVKAMHRLIMLSSTYQMSSAYDERAAETDPENKLLWHISRRRLEAEAIRDAVMATAGDLDLTAGGSIMNYKDRQYVANTSRRGDVDYEKNIRAVYIPVVRSSMYEVFTAFDLPDPSTPNGDRDSTVVAPQALFMMNGAVVLRHSRSMAEKLLADGSLDDARRIQQAYERALSRPPSARETDQALTFIARIGKALEAQGKEEKERRALAWQSFCKALIASNEFVYLN